MSRPKPSPITVSAYHLTQQQAIALDRLFEFIPPHQLREYLIEIFHSYMYHEHETLPSDFKDMALAITEMIDLLRIKPED